MFRLMRADSLALLVLAALAGAPLRAQEPAPPSPPPKESLRDVEKALERSGAEQKRLGYEIDQIGREAEALRQSLIGAAKGVQQAEQRLGEAEIRLADVTRREEALRASLRGRERITAEVLAAMQRIGRKPPPALLVAPEDALGAIRAAILLGAIVPDLRDEAMILVADLKTLTDLRREAEGARETRRQEVARLDGERSRLDELVRARQEQLGASRQALASETDKAARLAREARSLRDLLARSENVAYGDPRALELARRAPLRPETGGPAVASLSLEAGRLEPRRAFAELKGALAWPVAGTLLRRFGEPDGSGGTEKGVVLTAAKDAVVIAPADGRVHFAAPYRGYGHLLILNAGNGYHVVLAGLGRLSVEIGQFVLAGEPIGVLGLSPAIRTTLPNEASSEVPALAVEFRKDGTPVDPAPWWTSQTAEKARG